MVAKNPKKNFTKKHHYSKVVFIGFYARFYDVQKALKNTINGGTPLVRFLWWFKTVVATIEQRFYWDKMVTSFNRSKSFAPW